MAKYQLPQIGGIRKVIRQAPAGTTAIAGLEGQTVTIEQLAAAIYNILTNTNTINTAANAPGVLTVGPGLSGGGVLVGNVPIRLTASPPMFMLDDGADGEPGPPGARGKDGAAGTTGATGFGSPGMPGEDGIDGEQGPPGIPGAPGLPAMPGATAYGEMKIVNGASATVMTSQNVFYQITGFSVDDYNAFTFANNALVATVGGSYLTVGTFTLASATTSNEVVNIQMFMNGAPISSHNAQLKLTNTSDIDSLTLSGVIDSVPPGAIFTVWIECTSGAGQSVTVVYANVSVVAVQGATGLTGPVGPAGEDGAEGDQGPPGVPGVAGASGATGPQGSSAHLIFPEDGADGDTGPPGPAGAPGAIGVTGGIGPAGPAIFLEGEQGDEGDRGPPGAAGAAGAPGSTGGIGPPGAAIFLEGEQGEDGERGPPGQTGLQGIQGNTGAQGPAGPINPYSMDDGEIDNDIGMMVPGPRGAQGIQGTQGPAVHMVADDSVDNDASYWATPPGSPVIFGTFVGTLTGMTTANHATITYLIFGPLCLLSFPAAMTSTSNANTLTMTGLPNTCQPARAANISCGVINDASAMAAQVNIAPGSGTLTFYCGQTNLITNNVEFSTTGFLTTGTKGLDKLSLAYSLT